MNKILPPFFLIGVFITSHLAQAGSASWIGTGFSDWSIPDNWSPSTVPNGPGDTATFDAVDILSLPRVLSPIELDTLFYTSICPDFYTIEVDGPLTLSGAGIINDSGNTKVIYVKPYPAGELDFTNGAAAGDKYTYLSAVAETIRFYDESSASDAVLGVEAAFSIYPPGLLEFNDNSSGGTAIVSIAEESHGAAPGVFSIYNHQPPGVSIGGLVGGGIVLLGADDGPTRGRRLTVGGNNQSTIYQGVIQDAGKGGSLVKVGTGGLVLTGANLYGGGTSVTGGRLIVANKTGSGTGSGRVSVNGRAALGGFGTIAGAVTIGNGTKPGSLLSPSIYTGEASNLTIQGLLTIQRGGSYAPELFTGDSASDQVTAAGVTIGTGALFSFPGADQTGVPLGHVYTVILNSSGGPIAGTFANLADGSIFIAGSNHFQANYEGGDGNDLTLTAVQ